MKKLVIIAGLASLLWSCEMFVKNTTTTKVETIAATNLESSIPVNTSIDPKADQIIEAVIKAHGGSLYDQADYSFVFRKKSYRFKNDGQSFTYEVTTKDAKGNIIKDVIENGTFSRFVNNAPIELSEKNKTRYSAALNSVIYFATLPHKLKDAAVNKSYQGEVTIKGENYHVVKVFFDEEGGGADHDDVFYYWANKKTNMVDYFAYNYAVNGGGTRFRSYYNRRNVRGIVFQDYINWKANKNLPLDKLPTLFEKGSLKELSRIETEQVKHN